MANALKCPNPSCPFLFDPTQVPPGAILTCPRCGMRFTLGPVAPPVPSPPSAADEFDLTRTLTQNAPIAPPPSELPAKAESAAAQSLAATIKPKNASRPMVTTRRQEEKNQLLPVLGVLVVVTTAVAIGIAIIGKLNTGGSSNDPLRFNERNVSYRLPVPGWERSDDVKALIGVNLLGLKRSDASAIVAIEARDYKTRNPQPGELKEAIKDRLLPLFEELDPTEETGATWVGLPAIKYTFRGTAADKLGTGTHLGVAYAIAHKGIGYWFFAIAPESETNQLAAELDDLRGRMKFLAEREDWKATSSGSVLLVGDAADYRLTDGDGWWVKLTDPKIEDPQADIAYDAEFKSRVKRDIKPRARLAVLLLAPTSDDPMDALREYLRNQYDKLYGLKNWQELSDPPLGDSPSSGDTKGISTIRYKVSGSDANTSKIVVLAAIQMDAQTADGRKSMVVGAHASCPVEYQQLWEKRLVQLVGSLRPAK